MRKVKRRNKNNYSDESLWIKTFKGIIVISIMVMLTYFVEFSS
jgi:hypothetical protein